MEQELSQYETKGDTENEKITWGQDLVQSPRGPEGLFLHQEHPAIRETLGEEKSHQVENAGFYLESECKRKKVGEKAAKRYLKGKQFFLAKGEGHGQTQHTLLI